MSLMCRIFGHNYAITSALGNYAFCTKCGGTLTIKDPYTLVPGERRWIQGRLMECTELGLEEVTIEQREKNDYKSTIEKILSEEKESSSGAGGEEVVRSKDPHEQREYVG
tara:strand:+ start:5726 stop:6055 length:330 start_codon:yes stop_codon:yes gene_type:complete